MARQGSLFMMLLAGLLAHCDRSNSSPTTQPAASARPATELEKSVRVVLLREVPSCILTMQGPIDVVNAASGASLGTIEQSLPLTVTFTREGICLEELERRFEAAVLDLRPRNDGPVGVQVPEGRRRYRGWLRLVQRVPGRGSVVNVVDVEDYLPGVVMAEMPPSYQPAALRAQAIASRTFAWYKQQTYGADHDWDVTSTQSSQVYRGLETETTAGLRAVNDTAGIVCAWDAPEGERIFPTYFSSTCGGVTRPAPPINGQPDIAPLAGDVTCTYCADARTYRWGPVVIPKQQISYRLRERLRRQVTLGPIATVEISRRSAKGRPTHVEVGDDAGQKFELDVNTFRMTVDPTGRTLRSGHFTPVDLGDAIQFTDGRGMGHGWGMCQAGANGLAKAGKTAPEILQFYYPGSRLVRAY